MRLRILAVVCALSLVFPSIAAAQLRSVPYVSGLSLPLAFVQDPGDATIQYVLQQGGRIRLIRNGDGGSGNDPQHLAQNMGPSGYAVTASPPPGTWDLVVFAHSSVSGQFDAVQVIRVTVR